MMLKLLKKNYRIVGLAAGSLVLLAVVYKMYGMQVERMEMEDDEEVMDDEQSDFDVEPKQRVDENLGSVSFDDKELPQIQTKDLLPKSSLAKNFDIDFPESLNSPFSQKNFLAAGNHIGVNTVGSSLRNANRGIRSEPVNPIGPSPTSVSSITPDLYRRELEIGGCVKKD